MGFRGTLLALGAVFALATPAHAARQSLDLRLVHPGGASIRITAIDARARSTVLTAEIANPGDRAIRLDAARSFMLTDRGGGVWRLNPPAGNPELTIPARARLGAELVFIGPLGGAASGLRLSTNDGIGTPDNPYDTTPVFKAALPPAVAEGEAAGPQAHHPDGAALRVTAVAVYPDAVVLSLVATNGNAQTIDLDHAQSLVLRIAGGTNLPLETAAANPTLAVPPGQALAATLVFSGVLPAGTRQVTLSANDGSGTRDNPYDTMPEFELTLPVEGRHDGAPPAARLALTPIARSVLSTPTAISPPRAAPNLMAAAPAAPAPATPAVATPPAATPTAEPPSGLMPVAPPAASAPPPPEAAPPASVAPPPPPIPIATMSVPQLKRALHATATADGVTIALSADTLFGSTPDTLSPAAGTPLAELLRLIAATRPREIVVAGNTDGVGRDDANMKLSEERAEAVAAWIRAHDGRERAHIVAKGYGRTRPVAPNTNPDGSDNPAGRALNRRVDVSLQG